MSNAPIETNPDIHFMRAPVLKLRQICDLIETLPADQRYMVADNVFSIPEASFSECAW